jgi:zinc transporter ZupT
MLIANAVVLGGIPAIAMLLCTLVGLGMEVPHNFAGALQHFAAGILICSIATELLPAMKDATGFWEVFASGVGFFSGVTLMILVGILFPEAPENHRDDEVENAESHLIKRTSSASGRSNSLLSKAFKRTDSTISAHRSVIAEGSPLIGAGPTPAKVFPAAFLLTVCVDSILDGVLIGIATAAGPSAGPMLALSLCVEMSFLGLTLATAMAGQPSRNSIPASFLGPLFIVIGSCCGGLLSSALTDNPLAMIGLLSFGVAALLFMVAEELLLEAHEEGGNHIWWVDLQLYVGFFVSILLGKLVPE